MCLIMAGSTWTQEMTWLLANDLDYAGAKNLQLARAPVIEFTTYMYETHHEFVT